MIQTAHRASIALGRLLPRGDIAGDRPGAGHDNELHVDADAICPRCLRWIEVSDFVRRNAWGLAQHEACPAGVRDAGPPLRR